MGEVECLIHIKFAPLFVLTLQRVATAIGKLESD